MTCFNKTHNIHKNQLGLYLWITFLSTQENKLDKKGRVLKPAPFRSYLSISDILNNLLSTFNHQCLEAWPQDRIEKITNSIDSKSFRGKERLFCYSYIIRKYKFTIYVGRILLTSKLLKHAKIKNSMVFVGQGKTFQIWEPTIFEKFKLTAKKNQILIS